MKPAYQLPTRKICWEVSAKVKKPQAVPGILGLNEDFKKEKVDAWMGNRIDRDQIKWDQGTAEPEITRLGKSRVGEIVYEIE